MQHIIIADNQDITRAGLLYVLSHIEDVSCQVAGDKSELIHQLKGCPRAILILDYTLFDFSGTADLLVLGQRYPLAHLILWRRPQYRFHPQHCQCRPAGQCAYEGCKAVGNRTVP